MRCELAWRLILFGSPDRKVYIRSYPDFEPAGELDIEKMRSGKKRLLHMSVIEIRRNREMDLLARHFLPVLVEEIATCNSLQEKLSAAPCPLP